MAKKYPKVLDSVAQLFEQFEKGQLVGVEVTNLRLSSSKVFKTRIKNPDANKGKSGGFRLIWYLLTAENEIYPLIIYSKSDQEHIFSRDIRKLIKERVPPSL